MWVMWRERRVMTQYTPTLTYWWPWGEYGCSQICDKSYDHKGDTTSTKINWHQRTDTWAENPLEVHSAVAHTLGLINTEHNIHCDRISNIYAASLARNWHQKTNTWLELFVASLFSYCTQLGPAVSWRKISATLQAWFNRSFSVFTQFSIQIKHKRSQK